MLTVALALPATVITVTQTGCTAPQQRIAYNTLYSVEKTAATSVDAYFDAVVAGRASADGVPRVSAAYNRFRLSLLLALDAVQFNTNALAPEALVIESQDLVNLVSTFYRKQR